MTDVPVKKKIGSRSSATEIGTRVKTLRAAQGLDQKQLALQIGTRQNVVSEWEDGKYRPSAMALVALGNLADSEPEWWYEEAGPEYAAIPRLRAARDAGSRVDVELLRFVVEYVDEWLRRKELRLPSSNYAELVSTLYDYCHKSTDRESATLGKILQWKIA